MYHMYQCICDKRKIPDVVGRGERCQIFFWWLDGYILGGGGGGGRCQIFFGGLIDIFSVETPL